MSENTIFPAPLDGKASDTTDLLAPRFNADGLITAVVTDKDGGGVLMLAHMNAEALRLTIDTGYAHFWSRSRKELWKKGETSGALLSVHEVRVDCDQDAVWLIASLPDGKGACHTGAPSCFYRRVTSEDGAYKLVRTDQSSR